MNELFRQIETLLTQPQPLEPVLREDALSRKSPRTLATGFTAKTYQLVREQAILITKLIIFVVLDCH